MKGLGNHGYLLGDQGYGIAPYLMTPYENPITPSAKTFNRLHSQSRIIVEHAFGQLKRRFPFLRYCVRVKHERIPSYISACFILHNVAKSLQDPDFDPDINDFDSDDEVPVQPSNSPQQELQLRHEGKQKRDYIAMQLIT